MLHLYFQFMGFFFLPFNNRGFASQHLICNNHRNGIEWHVIAFYQGNIERYWSRSVMQPVNLGTHKSIDLLYWFSVALLCSSYLCIMFHPKARTSTCRKPRQTNPHNLDFHDKWDNKWYPWKNVYKAHLCANYDDYQNKFYLIRIIFQQCSAEESRLTQKQWSKVRAVVKRKCMFITMDKIHF